MRKKPVRLVAWVAKSEAAEIRLRAKERASMSATFSVRARFPATAKQTVCDLGGVFGTLRDHPAGARGAMADRKPPRDRSMP